jgi:hypothetical protein
MKANIDIRLEGYHPRRHGSAQHPWPFEQLPRKGEQVYGFGLQETLIEGVEVRSLSWMMGDDTVHIFAEIMPGTRLEGEAYDQACEALEMFGWRVQPHVPIMVRDPVTGEWAEKKPEDDDDDACLR